MLHDIVLQDHSIDRWKWLLDPVNGYSVKGSYHFLKTIDEPSERELSFDVWHKHVPLNVSLFTWRLFRNRLPTKDNLMRRCVLQHDDNKCVGDCDYEETTGHLFFGCATSSGVWCLLLRWLGISFVGSNRVCDPFLQFSHIAGLLRSIHSYMKLLWLACVWVVWKERNNWVFKHKALELHQITDRVKLLSFQWLKASLITFAYNYTDWWRHPLSCMSA